jgi:UDP-2-acetamido-2-deoxy-ribo-hexuluronate aminotransferase
MDFIDLKAQYAAYKPDIDARIRRVLSHAQFVMGPEIALQASE